MNRWFAVFMVLVTVCVAGVSAAAAQPGEAWNSSVGAGGMDSARDVVGAEDGYVYVGVSGGRHGVRPWVAAVDRGGEPVWGRVFRGSGGGELNAVVEAPHGVLVAGRVEAGGGGDGFAASLSRDGGVRWRETYGGTGDQGFVDAVEARDGYVLAGWSSAMGNASIGGRAWVLKLDRGGGVAWTTSVGGAGGLEPRAVVRGHGDGYLVAGTVRRNSEAAALKIAEGGGVEWMRTYGFGSSDSVEAALRTDDGYLLAGSTTDGGSDALLFELDVDGGVVWNNFVDAGPDGARSRESVVDVVGAGDGYAFLAARSRGSETGYWLGRTYSGGAVGWTGYYGWSGVDRPAALARTTDGYVLAGDTVAREGTTDALLVNVSFGSGVADTTRNDGGVTYSAVETRQDPIGHRPVFLVVLGVAALLLVAPRRNR